MIRPLIIFALACLSALSLAVIPAFAYDELDPPSGRACVDCHGFAPDDSGTGAPHDRSGPHGAYTSTTQKCRVCHSVHQAPSSFVLLPADTVKEVCESCHDGTGGRGVYGVIKARTGVDPSSGHRVGADATRTIPGGNLDGTPRAVVFSGVNGTLTCTDCHSPHGTTSRTIQPFIGDRYRSSVATATLLETTSQPTNRLLRNRPTGAETTATVYGTGWCATCHQGHLGGSGGAMNHPVQQNDHFYYNYLPVLTSHGASETVLGEPGQTRLGGSNLGYQMPDLRGSGEHTRTAEWRISPFPLCQQCHEDIRDATQPFTVTAADGSAVTDNPRFHVFPHESNAQRLLIVPPGQNSTYTDGLCLNCHLP
ncbi:MAG: cytochrome c3 family protein [Clostridiales bacterium]|nr:cytochrome c3 family protein [Clostridiales bacterium]